MMIGRLEQLCVEQGLRMTDQRRTILRVVDEMENHPSVEEIHERVIQYDRHISIATVYRTINILAEWGVLSRIELGDGKARYEEASDGQHEHLVDVDTGKVVELTDPAIEELLRRIAERCGYRLLNYRLELFGEASSGPARRNVRRSIRNVPIRHLRPTSSLAPAYRRPAVNQM